MLDPALVDPGAKAMGLPYVQGVKHYQHIYGSDHCPIGFVLWNVNGEQGRRRSPAPIAPKAIPEATVSLRSTIDTGKEEEHISHDQAPELTQGGRTADYEPWLDDEVMRELDRILEKEGTLTWEDLDSYRNRPILDNPWREEEKR